MRIEIIVGNCSKFPTVGQIVDVSEIEASHLIANGRAKSADGKQAKKQVAKTKPAPTEVKDKE